MRRLEHLCVQYLEAAINHRNVLVALQNASDLKLDFIKVIENDFRSIIAYCVPLFLWDNYSVSQSVTIVNFHIHFSGILSEIHRER